MNPSFSFIFLDKPRGPSTHEVVAYVRKLLGVKKAGQLGTLDPQVSGVLIIATGKATRLLQYVAAKEKTYIGVLRLRKKPGSFGELQTAMDRLVGRISQIPPKESAVAKKKRMRRVFEFTALELQNNTVLFRAKVEAGTYVRVMCVDVGKAYEGGKMIELRRIAVGEVDEGQICTLTDLQDAVWLWREKHDDRLLKPLLKPADAYLNIPRVIIGGKAVEAVCRGAPLAPSGVASAEANLEKGGVVQLRSQNGKLIGIAQWIGEKEVAAKPTKIFINTRAGIA